MDLTLDIETDLSDHKNHQEIQKREQLFEQLINYFLNDQTREEFTGQIVKILSKSELANPKYESQPKEEILEQIVKSIPKWKFKIYKKGDILYHFGILFYSY